MSVVVEKKRGELPGRVSLGELPEIRSRDWLLRLPRDAVDVLLQPGKRLGRACRLLGNRKTRVNRLQAGLIVLGRDQQLVRAPVGSWNRRALFCINFGTLLVGPLEQKTILVCIHNG